MSDLVELKDITFFLANDLFENNKYSIQKKLYKFLLERDKRVRKETVKRRQVKLRKLLQTDIVSSYCNNCNIMWDGRVKYCEKCDKECFVVIDCDRLEEELLKE